MLALMASKHISSAIGSGIQLYVPDGVLLPQHAVTEDSSRHKH
jgi:hypothetical protein